MAPQLRDPLVYSNWVWLLGTLLIVLALAWVITLLVLYRVRRVEKRIGVRTLGQLQRARYNRHIQEVLTDFEEGRRSARDSHFALASLVRAAASEKTGSNIESQTSAEVAAHLPSWPLLVSALEWCEDETFPPERATEQVRRGADLASEVVNG
ncbi:hypothetical protein [Actinomyces minihominis]|uniref:hypothetical protein n=1 Tax=Actinomyces minihominis TaxID=2002838 RepID=UPI000C077CC0|nr:hypothetical protein [Actinomyces minihominis]